MAKMASTPGAKHFRTRHSQTAVVSGNDTALPCRFPEAGPAGAGFELRVRAEQRVVTCGAAIFAARVVVPVFAGVGRLRTGLTEDIVLLARQKLLPFRIRVVNRKGLFRRSACRLDVCVQSNDRQPGSSRAETNAGRESCHITSHCIPLNERPSRRKQVRPTRANKERAWKVHRIAARSRSNRNRG